MRAIVTGGSGFIGRHMVAQLGLGGWQVLNLDVAAPPEPRSGSWIKCDILDAELVEKLFREFRPTHVVHLAAETSIEIEDLAGFRANTEGTANILRASAASPTLRHVVVTSTQHVRRPGSGPPRGEVDYDAYKTYGRSKVITEQLTRDANLSCGWTIVRPTAVWGPHHLLLAAGLWRLIYTGRYVHPANDPVIRSYGYVKNVAWQIEQILKAKPEDVNHRMLYVADGNGRQSDWINAISQALHGRNVRTVPLWLIRGLSRFGDGVKAVGGRFPLYEERFKNLTAQNPVGIDRTLQLFGPPPYSMQVGAEETAAWLREYYGRP